jgi:hypothetical protein
MSSEASLVEVVVSVRPSMWPLAVLGIALTANMGWIGLLGYGIFELGKMLF